MSTHRTIGQLFEKEPIQWGLRGDPYLWRKMRERFSSTPLPLTVAELETQLQHGFQELSGQSLSVASSFFVAEFAHGGMSSGHISPEFWRERALPLLLSRHAET